MELSRCFEVGDGVQTSEVTACAWLLLAASNGSAEAEKEFEFLRSRLSPEEILEAEAQANEYFYSSDAVGYPEAWYAEFNLVIAEKMAQQSEQQLTVEDILELMDRAADGDEEADRTLGDLGQMTDEEREALEQQVKDRLSAMRENQAPSNEHFNKDRKII